LYAWWVARIVARFFSLKSKIVLQLLVHIIWMEQIDDGDFYGYPTDHFFSLWHRTARVIMVPILSGIQCWNNNTCLGLFLMQKIYFLKRHACLGLANAQWAELIVPVFCDLLPRCWRVYTQHGFVLVCFANPDWWVIDDSFDHDGPAPPYGRILLVVALAASYLDRTRCRFPRVAASLSTSPWHCLPSCVLAWPLCPACTISPSAGDVECDGCRIRTRCGDVCFPL
jgi:hypothetical protein